MLFKNKIGNVTIYKVKIKCLCGIFTVLFTVSYVIPFSTRCIKSGSIGSLRVGFNSTTKYASEILRVNFLTEALQITAQLKWCLMLLFKYFEGFYFSDGMLCLFRNCKHPGIFYKLDVGTYASI